MRRAISAVLCLLPVVAMAGGKPDLAALTGIYRNEYKFYDGVQTGTDTVTLVALSKDRAYFDVDLSSPIGACGLTGVASVKPNKDFLPGTIVLEYRSHEFKGCMLDILFGKDAIYLFDGNSCRDTCGIREGYGGRDIPRASRHPIGELKTLKSSQSFISALREAGLSN